MTKEELLKLKKSLPKGSIKILADQHVLSVSYINMIFSGERENLEIVKSALEIAKIHKQKKSSISQAINKL